MFINPEILHQQLTQALAESIGWQGHLKHPKSENAYRSAYFCYQVGRLLDRTICDIFDPSPIRKRQICFSGDEKISGEWLLDIVWTEEHVPDGNFKCSIPRKICCAVECESSTSVNEFFVDFAKLLSVNSSIKIFLAGLDQTTYEKADAYQHMRLKQAEEYIAASKPVPEDTEWYLGFWPSPKKKAEVSLWDLLNQYSHLNAIYLYRYDDCRFVRQCEKKEL